MFKGSYTAIVTPFAKDKKVDVKALERLVEDQIAGGINGIVPCGTTGETPTLSDEERDLVIGTTVKVAKGRVPVIAGTGSNSTAHTVHYTKRAKELGADAALVVVPYYNKPSQEGMYQHFMTVAKESGLPVMLYNVPGRTGADMLADTVVRLQADEAKIVAIKEACGSTDRVAEVRARARKDFTILSGDDSLTLPMMAVGADGVVSVASNVVPAKVAQMVKAALDGDYQKARALHLQLRELFTALFVESNPMPAKAALASMGKMENELRLPLVSASEKTAQLMKTVLAKLG
jgi:4-hydroxy-tetrahydrodipicolinate synthase